MNTLLRLATVEMLKPHLGEGSVNVINVEHLARSRGIELVQIHEPQPPAGLVGDIVGIRAEMTNGESHRLLGTVYADGFQIGAGVEYRFANSPFSIGGNVGYVDTDGGGDATVFGITGRIDFGNDSLKSRDRTGNTFGGISSLTNFLF